VLDRLEEDKNDRPIDQMAGVDERQHCKHVQLSAVEAFGSVTR
jgi:hypothetical protein